MIDSILLNLSDRGRLAALRHTALLDRSAEESFDRLTQLAARILSAPVSLVSLVDEDRQFFKSCVGLPEPWASRRETPLSHSFCQHAVDAAEPLIIEDAREHPLVRENLAISDLGVIAYAGIPLITSGGHALGSFCVIDSKPRVWTGEEIGILKDLAASVMTEIEMRSAVQEVERQAEELKASEERFRLVARASNDILWEYNWQTNTLWWSENLHLFGYAPEQLSDFQAWEEKVHPEDRERVVSAIRTTVEQGHDQWGDEYRFRRANGEYAYIYDRGHVVYDAERKPLRQIGSIMDITERKRAEEALRRSEEQFRLLAENVREVFWISDPVEDRLVYASPAFEEIWGRPIDSLWASREAFLASIHPDDREKVIATPERVLEGAYKEDYRIIRPDGEIRWIRDRGFPVQDERGEVFRIVGVAEDITERKRSEEAERLLAESGAVLASSLDYKKTLSSVARLAVPAVADHCVVDIVNEAGEFERVEAAFADPLTPEIEQIVRQRYVPQWDVPHPSVEVVRSGESLLISEVTDSWITRYARDAEHLQLLQRARIRSVMAVPLIARGRTLGAVLFATGKSERRFGPPDLALTEEIARRAALAIDNAQLYQKAEQATRAREEVLAVVSHELRNPLNAIHLVIELLLDFQQADSLSADTRLQLESVRTSAEQMRRLVQDLLDITRIEAGHLAVHRQGQASTAIVDEALDTLRPLAESKSIRLDSRIPDELPAVLADRQRIVQVLINLVANAIRYVREGGSIVLDARTLEQEVCFAVSDTGAGIPEERLPHLFNRFWQAAGSGHGGLGLGLAIARGIIEAHGGRIWAESQVGKGSTFYFTLPVASNGTGADVFNGEDAGAGAVAILPATFEAVSQNASELQKDSAHRPAEAAQRSDRFLEEVSRPPDSPIDSAAALATHLRTQMLRALHLGYLRVNDRLPSIRQISSTLGVPYHAAVQAYESLAADGIVEKRERSGIYLAPQTRMGAELQGETARWVAEVLIGAWMHQIKVPRLPDLIRRFTTAVSLHCLCVESTEDHRTALATELSQQFGFKASPLPVADLPVDWLAPDHSLWQRLQDTDLLVTTSFHAPQIRQIAEELNKPLIVMTIHPEVVMAIEQRLAEAGELTVVCVDPAFGERVRRSVEGVYRDWVQVVLAEDLEAISALDHSQPVLLTRAARQRLPDANLRLIVPLSPSFSVETARDITKTLVRFNMEAARG